MQSCYKLCRLCKQVLQQFCAENYSNLQAAVSCNLHMLCLEINIIYLLLPKKFYVLCLCFQIGLVCINIDRVYSTQRERLVKKFNMDHRGLTVKIEYIKI